MIDRNSRYRLGKIVALGIALSLCFAAKADANVVMGGVTGGAPDCRPWTGANAHQYEAVPYWEYRSAKPAGPQMLFGSGIGSGCVEQEMWRPDGCPPSFVLYVPYRRDCVPPAGVPGTLAAVKMKEPEKRSRPFNRSVTK